MERLTDFSIDRILQGRPGPGPGPEAPGFLRPGLEGPGPGPGPMLVPVPVPSFLHYTGMNFGEQLYADFLSPHMFPHGVMVNYSAEAPPPPPHVLKTVWFQTPGPGPSAAVRPQVRVRTQFTDTQTEHLEALMEKDQYPSTDTRAQVARNIGLSDETVRVWFKNRRARRKRQRVDPLAKPSSSTRGADPERKRITCFL